MTDGGCDFEVKRVELDSLGIDAGQRLGMVIAQPEYELVSDGAVPFRISDTCREAQKDLIEKAFQIRAEESRERDVPIPFILFPEASIPVGDPDGLDCLCQKMEEVREDVIFIGGLEGLSLQEAQEIANRFAPDVDVARPKFADGTFVNVCVIVVKSASGLSWYFQAKLRPSPLEQPRNMACGRRVLHFVTRGVSFLYQICFDHIARDGYESLNAVLCEKLIKRAEPDAPILDFVFVPQYNPQPKHLSFRENTRRLLMYPSRIMKNDMTTIVVINKAASVQEPSEYGRSGFHYRAGRWAKLTADIGPKGYELYDSDSVTSAVFRKRTQAIHVATVIPPSHNIGNRGNPRLPLRNPRSYLIRNGCDPTSCSGLPGTSCPVGRYVECECLPCKLRDTLLAALPTSDDKRRWKGSDADQTQRLERHYVQIRKDLLMLECPRARELVNLLLHMHENDKRNNPDLWDNLQFEAVRELLSVLSVLAEVQPVSFETAPYWTALLGEALVVTLLDGIDKRHSWGEMADEHIKTFKDQYYRPEARKKPVLLIALRSTGQIETFVTRYRPDWTQPSAPRRLGDGDSFAEPTEPRFYVCQNGLFENARQADKIKEYLESKMRCIVE